MEIATDYFIDVTISPESYDKELVFKLAENTFGKIRIMNESYKEKIAVNLLQLHNEVWNEGKIISLNDFKKRINIQGILIFCEGNAELILESHDSS